MRPTSFPAWETARTPRYSLLSSLALCLWQQQWYVDTTGSGFIQELIIVHRYQNNLAKFA
jgi:hypothetical protein